MTGALKYSASALTSSSASPWLTPPPETMTGYLAPFSKLTASAISFWGGRPAPKVGVAKISASMSP